MEKITLKQLSEGLNINVKPMFYENDAYFDIEIKNAPYFIMCQYNTDTVDYDEETLLKVSSCNQISKEIADEFKEFFYSLLPKFISWDSTNIIHETIKFDENEILRIDFNLLCCENK